MRRLHILRPGTFTDAKGQRVSLSEAAIQDIAAGYDPAAHEAPLVVGHPKADRPAWGWVESLDTGSGGLFAVPRQVAPELSEAVRARRYKKISASLYGPDNPRNPNPGKWSLRHVGFLGAQPPAVTGLEDAQLSEAGEPDLTVEADLGDGAATAWTWRSVGDGFRRLREWIISEHDLETADRVLPDYQLDEFERTAAKAEEQERKERDSTQEALNMSEPTPEQLAEREAQLAQREAAIEARERADRERAAERRRQDNADFSERLASEGRLLPRHKDTVAGVLTLLDDVDDSTVAFSDGESVSQAAPGKALRELLSSLPVQVDLAERSGGPLPEPRAGQGAGRFRAPDGTAVDEGRLAIHEQALDLSEREGIGYEQALARVAGAAY